MSISTLNSAITWSGRSKATCARGMSPEEAKFAAQRLIGSVSLYKEECRDARGTLPEL